MKARLNPRRYTTQRPPSEIAKGKTKVLSAKSPVHTLAYWFGVLRSAVHMPSSETEKYPLGSRNKGKFGLKIKKSLMS